MDDEDRDFEHSPLSGSFTNDPWQLVVIGLSSSGCTAWNETFATDQEAYEAFTAVIEEGGMALFTGVGPPMRH